MRARDRVLGALTFATAKSGRRYDEDDLAPAAGLAMQVGLAIDNARLFVETRAAERRAEDDRALLDTLFATAPVGLGFFDREMRYQRVNAALAAINGVAADDHIGRTLEEVLPDMDPAVAPALRRVIDTGEPIVDHDVMGVTPAAPGELRHWLASYYPVRGEDREVVGIGAVVIEVTERRRSQDELRMQKELYEAILAAQSDVGEGFLILEEERIVYANVAAEEITGYPAPGARALRVAAGHRARGRARRAAGPARAAARAARGHQGHPSDDRRAPRRRGGRARARRRAAGRASRTVASWWWRAT